MRNLRTVGVLAAVIHFAAACTLLQETPMPARPVDLSPRVPTAQPASDEEAIRQLVLLEGRGIVEQDIGGLMDLWQPEGMVIDAKNTPDDPSDDARWEGRDAIRDRYVVLVFPSSPSAAGAAEIEVEIHDDDASAVSTTRIGDEVAPGGDRWTFVRRDGRWWIASLTYNLEPK